MSTGTNFNCQIFHYGSLGLNIIDEVGTHFLVETLTLVSYVPVILSVTTYPGLGVSC